MSCGSINAALIMPATVIKQQGDGVSSRWCRLNPNAHIVLTAIAVAIPLYRFSRPGFQTINVVVTRHLLAW